ncbi:MAG: XRE family transcriptional regulator [Proteobacteria bacterium]|nr:XRE family transcriptional regulator [Pseudomonadota bacterium]
MHVKNYKLTRFSSERLMRFLTLLDRDVEIVIPGPVFLTAKDTF